MVCHVTSREARRRDRWSALWPTRVAISILTVAVLTVGCSDGPGGGGSPGGSDVNEDTESAPEDTSGEPDADSSNGGGDDTSTPCGEGAEATVSQIVPDEAPIHYKCSRSFETDAGTAAFTLVDYGEEQDCPSGCITSNLCAIEKGGEAQLFWGGWYSASEAPKTLNQACPNLSEDDLETYPDCEPPGLTHPLTETPAFREFVENQKEGGSFSTCLQRYDASRFGP